MNMQAHHRVRAIVAFAAGLLTSALAFELGLGLIEATPLWRVLPVVEPILGQPDADTGYALSPGVSGVWPREHRARVRINSLGLRDSERSRDKPAGVMRVGVLGDSVVEALQVDQERTFTAVAERLLRQRGARIEVLNLGQSGNGPLRQLVRLEKFGYPLDLDVVVSITSAADMLSGELLDDSLNPGYVPGPDGRLVVGRSYRQRFSQRFIETRAGRLFVAAYQHSDVFRMLYLKSREPWRDRLGLPPERARPAAPDACHAGMLQRLLDLWRGDPDSREWQATERVFEDLLASTRRHDVVLVYAFRDIPLPPAGCVAETAMRAALVGRIEAYLAAHGIAFVDWLAELAAEAGTGGEGDAPLRGYLGFGSERGAGHLNHEGHEAYGRLLVAVLERTPR